MFGDAGPMWSGPQLAGNWDVITHYAALHVQYTLLSLALGAAVALPLGYAGHRSSTTYAVLLALTNLIYAIPSLALFVLLFPFTGITNDKPVIIAMALYSLVILLRSIVEGLRAVPAATVTAARAMGFGTVRRFFMVELPLAVPTVIAGLRLATVSTVSLVSVGGLIGKGGLGRLFRDGFDRRINVEIWSGLLAIVVIALVADALLLLIGRLLTPWARTRPSTATVAAPVDLRGLVAERSP
jgi:osmoprotectant transport system permease protein